MIDVLRFGAARAAAVLAFAVLSGCGSSGSDGNAGGGLNSSAAVPFPPTADADAFYQAPSSLPDAPPGTILNSRSVTFAPIGGVPLPNQAWQLQFISRDVNGKPIAAIATVVMPQTPAVGTARLVAFQYAEDGLGSQCAPSHTLSGGTADATSQAESTEPLVGLDTLGWTLVYPDHEGPSSAYGAGRIAGQITLDSIRAAEAFKPLGLNAQTPVAMWGYSGGAIATAWAATLQHRYAPALNIVGIASGGTPADVVGIVRNADTNPITNTAFFALIFSAVEGVNRSYPNLVTPILNDKGRAAFTSLADGCVGATTDGSPAPRGHLADYTTLADPLDAPSTQAIAPEISLPQPNDVPAGNTFVYHSQLDELIPIAGADAMVAAWCGAGSHISYYRGVSGDHVVFEVSLAPLVIGYLAGRLSGTPVDVLPPGTTTCN